MGTVKDVFGNEIADSAQDTDVFGNKIAVVDPPKASVKSGLVDSLSDNDIAVAGAIYPDPQSPTGFSRQPFRSLGEDLSKNYGPGELAVSPEDYAAYAERKKQWYEKNPVKPVERGLIGGIAAGVVRGTGNVLKSAEDYADYLEASRGFTPATEAARPTPSLAAAGEQIVAANPKSESVEKERFTEGGWKDLRWYTEGGSEIVPTLLAQLGALYATKGQSAGTQFLAFSAPAVVQAAGSTYDETLKRTGDQNLAMGEATVNGIVALGMQKLNLGVLLKNPTGRKVFQNAILNRIAKASPKALAAGGTGALGSVAQNASTDLLKWSAENDPEAFSDWKERYAAGGAQGFVAGVGLGGIHAMTEASPAGPKGLLPSEAAKINAEAQAKWSPGDKEKVLNRAETNRTLREIVNPRPPQPNVEAMVRELVGGMTAEDLKAAAAAQLGKTTEGQKTPVPEAKPAVVEAPKMKDVFGNEVGSEEFKLAQAKLMKAKGIDPAFDPTKQMPLIPPSTVAPAKPVKMPLSPSQDVPQARDVFGNVRPTVEAPREVPKPTMPQEAVQAKVEPTKVGQADTALRYAGPKSYEDYYPSKQSAERLKVNSSEEQTDLAKSMARLAEIGQRFNQIDEVVKAAVKSGDLDKIHEAKGSVSVEGVKLQNEASAIMEKYFKGQKPEHLISYLQELGEASEAKPSVEFSGKPRIRAHGGGFVDFTPVIEPFFKAGKVAAEHLAIAADWVMKKLGSSTMIDAVRDLLVKRFGGAVKPYVTQIHDMITRFKEKSKTSVVASFLTGSNLIDQLSSLSPKSGSKIEETAAKFRNVVDTMKQGFGKDSQTIDLGLKMASKPSKASTELNDVQNVPGTSKTFVSNARVTQERSSYSSVGFKPTVNALSDAVNKVTWLTGRKAESFIDGFKASGKYTRFATRHLVEALRQGSGRVYEAYVQGVLDLNKSLTRAELVDRLNLVKDRLNEENYDAAYRLLSQEHVRDIERVPSGMWQGKSQIWFYHDMPAEHISISRDRILGRGAFKQAFKDQSLLDVRKELVKENPDAGKLFDELTKSVHGIPLGPQIDPSSLGASAERIVNTAQKIAVAASTLYATLSNAVEIPFGNNTAVFGGAATIKSLWYLARHGSQGLENLGFIDRQVHDFSIQPSSGITRNLLRLTRNALATPNAIMNELGEKSVAATAKLLADRIFDGSASAGDRKTAAWAARSILGMSAEEVSLIQSGKASRELLNKFARGMPAKITGGNIRMPERSFLANTSFWNRWFPMMSYPEMQIRMMSKTLKDVMKPGLSASERATSATKFINVWGGTAIRGVMSGLVVALMTGGMSNLKIAMREDKEKLMNDPTTFLAGLYLKGIGGPLAMVEQFVHSDNPSDASLYSYRARFIQETLSLLAGKGRYKGLSWFDKASLYAQQRLPASRIPMTWIAIMGLGQKDQVDHTNVVRAFWRWKRDQKVGSNTTVTNQSDADELWRQTMSMAADKIAKNEDPTDDIKVTLDALNADKKARSISSSLLNRRYLSELRLTEDQIKSLKAIVGEDGYDYLLEHDDLLTAWADSFKEGDSLRKEGQPKLANAFTRSPSKGEIAVGKAEARVDRKIKDVNNAIQGR